MLPPEPILLRSGRWLTFGSAVAIMIGIAPSQILLALAFAALLASGEKLRLPRIKLPLALFLLGTLISLAFSGDIAAGLPGAEVFCLFGAAGCLFASSQHEDGPLAVSELGEYRRSYRDSRLRPVCREG